MKILGLLLVLALSVAGCVVVEHPFPQPSFAPQPTPQQCYLTVVSAASNIWGYVWVNGKNTGIFLSCYSRVQIALPCCSCFVVQIVDQWGVGSHWEYACSGEEVVFYYW